MSGIVDGIGYSGQSGTTDGANGEQILQVQHVLSVAAQSIDNTSAIILTKTFNRIETDSKFLVNAIVSMGSKKDDGNQDDSNPLLKIFVNGAAIETNGSLTGDGFYASDVPGWRSNVIYNASYATWQMCVMQVITNVIGDISSPAAGDEVIIALQATAGSGGMHINRARSTAAAGGTTAMNIFEIAN